MDRDFKVYEISFRYQQDVVISHEHEVERKIHSGKEYFIGESEEEVIKKWRSELVLPIDHKDLSVAAREYLLSIRFPALRTDDHKKFHLEARLINHNDRATIAFSVSEKC